MWFHLVRLTNLCKWNNDNYAEYKYELRKISGTRNKEVGKKEINIIRKYVRYAFGVRI